MSASHENYIFVKSFDVPDATDKTDHFLQCLRHSKTTITDKKQFMERFGAEEDSKSELSDEVCSRLVEEYDASSMNVSKIATEFSLSESDRLIKLDSNVNADALKDTRF